MVRMRRTLLIPFLLILCGLNPIHAQESVEFTVFLDTQSLTIYVHPNGNVSLEQLGFQVQVNNSAQTFMLSAYPAFGMPFAQIPTPICFRLRLSGSQIPPPIACAGIPMLVQDLAAADVFWYDSVAQSARVILLTQNNIPFAICPSGTAQCEGSFIPPSPTPLPPATATPLITKTLRPTATDVPRATATPRPVSTRRPSATPDGLSSFTAEFNMFRFYYPEDWVVREDGWLYNDSYAVTIATSSELFESQLSETAMQRGEHFIQITLGTIAQLSFNGASDDSIAALIDFYTTRSQMTPIIVYDQINGREAAIVDFTERNNDAMIIIMPWWDTNEDYFLVFGETASNARELLRPFMHDVVESLRP